MDSDNYSILFSGGVDSTLLLVKYAHLTPRAFTFGQTDEKIDHLLHPILREVERITGYQYPLTHLKGKLLIRPTVERIQGVYPGYVLTGCNRVLTHLNPTVYIEGDTPPVRGPALNEYHWRPFIDWDKAKIIAEYHKNSHHHLLSLTRSCGLGGYERCGGCYFCLERAWGFEQVGIPDINNAYPHSQV